MVHSKGVPCLPGTGTRGFQFLAVMLVSHPQETDHHRTQTSWSVGASIREDKGDYSGQFASLGDPQDRDQAGLSGGLGWGQEGSEKTGRGFQTGMDRARAGELSDGGSRTGPAAPAHLQP